MTEPVRPLEALIAKAERDAQAHLDEATTAKLHGNADTERMHRTLARVHHWFVVELKKIALLQAAAPPAPTAEPTIDEQVLRDLETRIFYAETSLKALVDSARLWKSLASTPAAPPERVSEGKE